MSGVRLHEAASMGNAAGHGDDGSYSRMQHLPDANSDAGDR